MSVEVLISDTPTPCARCGLNTCMCLRIDDRCYDIGLTLCRICFAALSSEANRVQQIIDLHRLPGDN